MKNTFLPPANASVNALPNDYSLTYQRPSKALHGDSYQRFRNFVKKQLGTDNLTQSIGEQRLLSGIGYLRAWRNRQPQSN